MCKKRLRVDEFVAHQPVQVARGGAQVALLAEQLGGEPVRGLVGGVWLLIQGRQIKCLPDHLTRRLTAGPVNAT